MVLTIQNFGKILLLLSELTLIILKMSDENAHTGSVCLQQAETVRLVVMNGQTQGVNELMIDDLVMARFDSSGRHVGSKISAKVTER